MCLLSSNRLTKASDGDKRSPNGRWLSLNVQMLFKSLLMPQFANNLLSKAIHVAQPYSWIREIDLVSSLDKLRIIVTLTIYYTLKIFSMTTVHCPQSNIFSTYGIQKGNGTCLISTFSRMHFLE